jgi:hypothetical protein
VAVVVSPPDPAKPGNTGVSRLGRLFGKLLPKNKPAPDPNKEPDPTPVIVSVAPALTADSLRLLPADTDLVAMINVKQILESDVVKKYALEQIKQVLEGQDAKKLLADLGVDPLKDVEKLTAASIDTKFGKQEEMKYLLIVHGTFDAVKLYKSAEAAAKVNGDRLQIMKDGGTFMLKFQPDGGQPPVYATVLNNKTVVVGSEKKLITEAVARASSDKPPAIKKELATLLQKLDGNGSVNLAACLKGKLDDVKLPGGGNLPLKLDKIEKVLALMETAVVTVKIGTDIGFEATIGMKDEDSAGEMRNALDDLLKQLKPLAQFAGAADPKFKPLAGILDGVKITTKKQDVIVTGKISGADIGKMIKGDD